MTETKQTRDIEHSVEGQKVLDTLEKLRHIEARSRSFKVRCLDRISDTLLSWSNVAHRWASKSVSPDGVGGEDRRREDIYEVANQKQLKKVKEELKIERQISTLLRTELELARDELLKIKKATEIPTPPDQ